MYRLYANGLRSTAKEVVKVTNAKTIDSRSFSMICLVRIRSTFELTRKGTKKYAHTQENEHLFLEKRFYLFIWGITKKVAIDFTSVSSRQISGWWEYTKYVKK